MSEERSELVSGPTPGKRPLDLTGDNSTDPDDSSLAPKRIKVADGLTEEDAVAPQNSISNGDLDSPARDVSPASNGEGNHVEDSKAGPEPRPKHVAEEEKDTHPETNGDESSAPDVDSNSQDSTPCDTPPQTNTCEDGDNGGEGSEKQSSKDVSSESSPQGNQIDEVDLHKEKPSGESVSDNDTSRTDNSGSCNGDKTAQCEGESQSKKPSVEAKDTEDSAAASESAADETINKAESDSKSENERKVESDSKSENEQKVESDSKSENEGKLESDSEAMEVDIDNDSAGTGTVVDKEEAEEAEKADVVKAEAEKVDVIAEADKADVNAEVEKEDVIAEDEKKDVIAEADKADVNAEAEKADVIAEAEKADVIAEAEKVDVISEAEKADVNSEAVKADVVNTEAEKADVVKADEVDSSERAIVSDTSVPKDSSDETVSKHVDSDGGKEPSEKDTEQMDTEDSATGKSCDSQDLSKESDLDSNSKLKDSTSLEEKLKDGTEESSEKKTVPDSTCDSMDTEDDYKENKAHHVDHLLTLSEEQLGARSEVMKKLNEELRNEETKLLLLKKLRLSQQQPVVVPPKPEGADAATVTPSVNGATPPTVNAQGHQPGVPMRISHSAGTGNKPHASIQPQSNSSHRPEMPQLMRGSHIQRQLHNYQKGHSGPPPLIMAQASRSNTSTSQSGQMVRAPVVRISSSSASSTPTSSISRQMQHAQQQRQQQQSSRQSQMANDGQSAASRQAAAKLALRKQLEKTLLQIPPPKPPPPELHFLPSAANNEFVILVGLEEVVNTILDMDKRDKNQSKGFLQPYKCAQCNTDFTTIWKQDPKQGIMCEACIVSNQKKALKAEHTNRLKTAFVKALQQEQEIEQRIQQSQSTQQQSATRVSSNVQQRHRQPAIVHRSHGGSMHHSSSSSSHGQQHKQRVIMNPAPSQRVVPPIHYAYIPNLPVSAPQIQIIPKQHMMAAQRSSADRQREYLLDMIPSKGLGHPQNPVIWKR